MAILIVAALVFLALHLFVAGTRMRDAITGAIGVRPYLGLFSLASLAVIVWLAISYNHAQEGPDPLLYDLGPGIRHLGIPVIAIAFFLGVQGLLMRSPTRVQVGEATTIAPDTVSGVLRITRHPFLWSVVIWSAFHLAANGDEASIILFGTFLYWPCLALRPSMRNAGARWVRPGSPLRRRPRTSLSPPSLPAATR